MTVINVLLEENWCAAFSLETDAASTSAGNSAERCPFCVGIGSDLQNRSRARLKNEVSIWRQRKRVSLRACTGRRDVSNGLTPGHLGMGSADYEASAMPFDF
ncbi:MULTISPECIES: hypothetical protein [Mesorhizobium]|uniref:hypothetical protein n=1 Tax=Mesorhizobium TaxID=68287 RepID=UPI0012E27CA9|nr:MULTISPECIES: hypothetical protein [Mesorhizobium]MUT27144.1 hypothetical protein [Mesorhizobium japonicum]